MFLRVNMKKSTKLNSKLVMRFFCTQVSIYPTFLFKITLMKLRSRIQKVINNFK